MPVPIAMTVLKCLQCCAFTQTLSASHQVVYHITLMFNTSTTTDSLDNLMILDK